MELSSTWVVVMLMAASLSFFFSGMEAGVFALNPVRIRFWERKGHRGAAALGKLLQQPEEFLWTILVGNTLANFVLVVLAVLLLFEEVRGRHGLVLGGLALGVFAFYALGDLLPKMLFQRYPNRLCLISVLPFRWLHFLLSPLVLPLRWASRWVTPRTRAMRSGGLSASREELRLTLLEQHPALTSDERVMIGRVLDLANAKVRQLAMPLERACSVTTMTPLAEVFRLCQEKNLTRVPVWEGGDRRRSRRIAGVLSLKTLLYTQDLDRERKAADFLKPALFLPETLGAEEALLRMKRSGQRMAIVLGRNRQETGVLTLQRILRFVFGEVTI